MIIWKGRGLLILLFAALGAMAFAAAFKAISHGPLSEWNTVAGMIGASVGIWVCAMTVCKPNQQTFLDPATRSPIVLKRTHDLYFLSARSWAILISLVTVATIMLTLAAVSPLNKPAEPSSLSGKTTSEFTNANRLIDIYKDKVAHGNTAAAESLAEVFATNLSSLRDEAISKGRSSSFSATKGRFLTYCHIAGNGVCFMVHVPELRKFKTDAKDAIAQLAWIVASAAAKEMNPPATRIAIGIRGAILYDRTWVGTPVKDIDNPEATIQSRSSDSDDAKNLLSDFLVEIEKRTPPVLETTPISSPGKKKPKLVKSNSPTSTVVETVKTPVTAVVVPTPIATTEPKPTPATAPEVPSITPPPAPPILPTAVREWNDSAGRPLKASLERFTSPACDTAEFKREDGQAFQISVSKFSQKDQDDINKIAEKVKAEQSGK